MACVRLVASCTSTMSGRCARTPSRMADRMAAGSSERGFSSVTTITSASRAQAIRDALALASEQDTVIITGKGHEPTQEIAGVFHRYNDRDVLIAARTSRQEQHA